MASLFVSSRSWWGFVLLVGWGASCAAADEPAGSSGSLGGKKGGAAGQEAAAGSSGSSGQSSAGSSNSPFPSGSLGGGGAPSGVGGAAGQGGNSFGAGGSSSSSFGGAPLFGGSAGMAGSEAGGVSGSSGQSGTGGSASGSGGAAAGAGGAACIPDCAGRQCGPDPTGCGVQCGQCAAGSQCTAQGLCQEVCSPTWSKPIEGLTGVGQLRVVEGKAYTVGHKSGVPWIGSFSVCSGAQVQQVSAPIPGSDSSSVTGLTFANGSFHAVGTIAMTGGDGGEGLYLNLDKSLNVLSGTPLFGSNLKDELSATGVAPSGNLWLAGTASISDTATNGAWMVKGLPASQKYCGFPAATGISVGRAVAVDGSFVWIAGSAESQGYLGRFVDASCGAEDPCGCKPGETITVKVGQVSSEIRGLLAWKGTLYAAGFADDGAGIYGFAARISPATLAVEGIYRWDPTPDVDVFLDLATDGSRLFLAGGQGWKGEADLSSAKGVLLALPLGFSSSSQPDWSKIVLGSRAFFGISASSADGVLASGKSVGGLVVRCTTDGQCP